MIREVAAINVPTILGICYVVPYKFKGTAMPQPINCAKKMHTSTIAGTGDGLMWK